MEPEEEKVSALNPKHKILHYKQAHTIKDKMWLYINTLRRRLGPLNRPTIAKLMGSYATKLNYGDWRTAFDYLMREGIFQHPKHPKYKYPLKTQYILTLPDDEIEKRMFALYDSGKHKQGNTKKEEPEVHTYHLPVTEPEPENKFVGTTAMRVGYEVEEVGELAAEIITGVKSYYGGEIARQEVLIEQAKRRMRELKEEYNLILDKYGKRN